MKLLDVKDVAGILKAKPSTIYLWVEQGIIPSFKINGLLRFDLLEVMEWIEKCRSKPGVTKRATRKINRPVKGVGIDGLVRRAIDTFSGSGISYSQGETRPNQARKGGN